MKEEHRAEFEMNKSLGIMHAIIWVINVVNDIGEECDNPGYVKEHADDVHEALGEILKEIYVELSG